MPHSPIKPSLPRLKHTLISPLLLLAAWVASNSSAAPQQLQGSDTQTLLGASLREQRASRDLYGAKRYMDRSSIVEAQNILEEDDDKRGSHRLA